MLQTSKAAAKAAAFLKQKKYRHQTGEFLVEGLRNVEEAVEYAEVKTLFFLPGTDQRTLALLKKAEQKGIELSETTSLLLEQIADTETPQGVVAVCNMVSFSLEDIFAPGKLVLVLDRIQDPGNLGTLLRIADALGVGGVVCLRGTADVYAPKVVRSAMGSLYHLPVAVDVGEGEFLAQAVKAGYEVAVTALEGGENILSVPGFARRAVVMGNEANGVSPSLLAAAQRKIYIPMQGRAESLNVAAAAAIALFELGKKN